MSQSYWGTIQFPDVNGDGSSYGATLQTPNLNVAGCTPVTTKSTYPPIVHRLPAGSGAV
jgi:hypothetical protein